MHAATATFTCPHCVIQELTNQKQPVDIPSIEQLIEEMDAAALSSPEQSWLTALLAAASAHAAQLASSEEAAGSAPVAVSGAQFNLVRTETVSVLLEAFDAAERRGNDIAIPVFAMAELTARLASAYSVPIAVSVLRASDKLTAPAETSPTQPYVIVAATLGAVAITIACVAVGAAIRRRAAQPPRQRLKRKTSDFPMGNPLEGNKELAMAAMNAARVEMASPGRTPRSGVPTPRSARRLGENMA